MVTNAGIGKTVPGKARQLHLLDLYLVVIQRFHWGATGVMTTLKRTASSLPNKDGKKHKDEDCVVCCNPVTDGAMECIWCEARLHVKCAKFCEELCLIGNATRNVVFFCNPCLETLPDAFKSYDGFTLVDCRVSTIEKSISDIRKPLFRN